MPRFRRQLGRFVAAHRGGPSAKAAALARSYLAKYENSDYDFETNGESWLLNRIARISPSVVFDVGANVGEWSAAVRSRMPEAEIHAFELVPDTGSILAERFAHDDRVHVNRVGLLDGSASTAKVKTYQGNSRISSVTDYPHNMPFEWIEAPVTTGDSYLERTKVDRLDLLKVDAEGADHLVVKGFHGALSAGRIRAIQFEYGLAAIRSHFLLADWYELLVEEFGMTIGKLYPRSVDFRAYDIARHEDFIGPNYVAVARDDHELLGLLGD